MAKAIIFTDMAGYYGFGRAAGAYRIASEFRKHGQSIKVVDCFCSFSLEQIKTIILNYKTSDTEWIGFSTTFMVNLESNSMLDDAKTKNKNFAVEKNADSYTGLYFEEEQELFSWVKSLGLRVVLGGYRTRTAGYQIDPDVEILTGPAEDRFFKDFNFTDSQIYYEEDDFIQEEEDLPIEVARGCIFKCKFCFFPLLGKKLWEFVKPPEVLREEMMRNYINFGTTGYMISDDTYNDSVEKIETLHKMYKTLPFDLTFSTYARLDLMIAHPHTMDILYDSGMRSVFFGIETFNHEAGKFVGKGMDPDKVKRGLLDFREKYPDVLIYASMIAGLPGESIEELNESHRFLTQEAKVSNVLFHNLSITPGTDLELNAGRYGYKLRPPQWTREDGLTSEETRDWCVQKRTEYENHPGGYVFYNRVRNLGYTDDELLKLKFSTHKQEILDKTNEKRKLYINNLL